MISPQTYSFRMQSRLAISLSWVAGYVNVVGLIACGHMLSHTTGNVTHLGQSFVDGIGIEARYYALLLACFLFGAALSAIFTETSKRRGGSKFILPMSVEALLLIFFALMLRDTQTPDAWAMYWSTGSAAMAMGLQNATITQISGAVVRTTHLTGVVTDLGLESVQLFLWWKDRTRGRRWSRSGRLLRVSQRHPTMLRILLLASIFGSFIFGVAAGAFVFAHWPGWVIAPPVLFLLWIVLVDWWTPIADVREIDLLGDPELASYGIIKTLLPAELGIYRMLCHRNAMHEMPSFQRWVELLPSHWKVVILALSPLAKLDTRAVLDLKRAVERLRDDNRRLVLAGVTRRQFEVLDAHDFDEVVGAEDILPDLEFAIVRGIALLD